MNYCQCGCGQICQKRYVSGHNLRHHHKDQTGVTNIDVSRLRDWTCPYCIETLRSVSLAMIGSHANRCIYRPQKSSQKPQNPRGNTQLNTPEAIAKKRQSISSRWKEGRYDESTKQNALNRIGKSFSEAHRKALSEAGLKSPHRRLRRGITKYRGVLLDSSWEVALARRLDQLGVVWTRPGPVQWIDDDGRSHHYFPDFYLPRFDLYLDPKNPGAVRVQRRKIDILIAMMPNLRIITTLEECETFTP